MSTTNIVMAVCIAAVVTIISFIQLKKKDEYTTGKLILITAITFVLCTAACIGVEFLMSNINFFGN